MRGEFRRRGLHPLAAVALSAVWPGLGHFGHSNRRALPLAFGTLGITALLLAFVVTRSGITLLAWILTPLQLQIAIIGAVIVLVFRIAVAVDAYRVARRLLPSSKDDRTATVEAVDAYKAARRLLPSSNDDGIAVVAAIDAYKAARRLDQQQSRGIPQNRVGGHTRCADRDDRRSPPLRHSIRRCPARSVIRCVRVG